MEDKTELSSKAVEITHTQNYDLVVNLNYRNQLVAKELKDVLKDGIPESWIPLEKPEWNEDVDNKPLYFKDAPQPRFFAKKKKNSPPGEVREVLEGKRFNMGGKQGIQAFNSLINEIGLVPEIKKALMDPVVKDILAKYGFNKIEFVEPIIGLIERKTGKKIMVYDFINGDAGHTYVKGDSRNKIFELDMINNSDSSGSLSDDMAAEISSIFAKHNIKTNDLGFHQFMSSKDNGSGNFTLYLIDAEGYHKA